MASGSATGALKAAIVVAAVLAMLVLPSWAAAPAPVRRRCKDCGPYCISSCRVSVPPKCSKYCDVPSCEDCMSSEIKKCKARCAGSGTGTGTGSCDCDDGMAARSCQNSCSGSSSSCADCMRQSGKQCAADCNSNCAANCV